MNLEEQAQQTSEVFFLPFKHKIQIFLSPCDILCT